MEKNKIKKIILVIAFLAFVSFVAYLLWTLFIKQESLFKTEEENLSPSIIFEGLPSSSEGDKTVIPGTTEEGGTMVPIETGPSGPQEAQDTIDQNLANQIAAGGLTQTNTIIDTRTLSPSLNKFNNSIQFYNKDDQLFYKIDENGILLSLGEKKFENVEDIKWSPNNVKAIIEFSDKTKIIYDFDKKNQVTLPSHFEDFTFSANGNSLVGKSMSSDSDNQWLIVSNNDGSQVNLIEKIDSSKSSIIPSWSPNNQSIAMYTKNIGFNKQEVIFIGEHGENLKSIIVEGQGFQAQWSQSGDKLLYSTSSINNDLKPGLWIVNASGQQTGTNNQNLNLETWAEKCTFANNYEVYCAVPKYINPGSTILSQSSSMSFDDLYKINVNTGQKTLIAIPDKNYNISSIMINQGQSDLYFTDYNSGKIHKIDL